MIRSMTGFGSKEGEVLPFGKVAVELRSTNHKFLEIVVHVPEGLLSLEDKIKKELEKQIKRGRVICAINIVSATQPAVFINRRLLKNYLKEIRDIQRQFRIKDEPGLDILLHLPGIFSLGTSVMPPVKIWPGMKLLVERALDNLIAMRQKEGRELHLYLKTRTGDLRRRVEAIKKRFARVIQKKLREISSEEESAGFLKDTDITEEIERLAFHIRNMASKLTQNGAMGKELDFIAQEMQREANTMAAKSCDALMSGRIVWVKGQIEKIREQLQNIE